MATPTMILEPGDVFITRTKSGQVSLWRVTLWGEIAELVPVER